MLRLTAFGAVLVVLMPFVGCDDPVPEEEPTTKVTGTVKLDGKVLPKGTIVFESPDDALKGLPAATGEIKNGEFQVEARAGEKTVRISARQETGPADETGVKPTKETIPAKFNEKSTLKKTVSADGLNVFTFDLKSK